MQADSDTLFTFRHCRAKNGPYIDIFFTDFFTQPSYFTIARHNKALNGAYTIQPMTGAIYSIPEIGNCLMQLMLYALTFIQ